jgi:hypothetical protein
LKAASQLVSKRPWSDASGPFFGEKEGILGLNRLFLGLKMGKIRGLQLLIRQQGENASY